MCNFVITKCKILILEKIDRTNKETYSHVELRQEIKIPIAL